MVRTAVWLISSYFGLSYFRVLVDDLLYALMLPSGNDAAVVLAENFGCLLYFDSIGEAFRF